MIPTRIGGSGWSSRSGRSTHSSTRLDIVVSIRLIVRGVYRRLSTSTPAAARIRQPLNHRPPTSRFALERTVLCRCDVSGHWRHVGVVVTSALVFAAPCFWGAWVDTYSVAGSGQVCWARTSPSGPTLDTCGVLVGPRGQCPGARSVHAVDMGGPSGQGHEEGGAECPRGGHDRPTRSTRREEYGVIARLWAGVSTAASVDVRRVDTGGARAAARARTSPVGRRAGGSARAFRPATATGPVGRKPEETAP